jgi:ATP-dependent DNA helicase RecG
VAAARAGLDDGIDRLPGGGPVTAARMAERGVCRVRDLLYFFPRAYEDYRRVYGLAEIGALPPGTSVVVRGTVVRVHRFFRRLLDVHLADGGVTLRARWFRPNVGMAKTYARGTEVALAGSLRRGKGGEAELVHPRNVTALLTESAGAGIRPRYSLVPKVPGRTIEKLATAALDAVGRKLPEILPESLRARLGLPGIAEALSFVHRPPPSVTETDLAALAAGT